MKILFITPRLPYPPIKGDKLRAYHFIKGLGQNHTIDLCSFIESPKEQEYVAELKKHCRSVEPIYLSKLESYINAAFGLFNKLPLQVNYYFSRQMQERINCIVKRKKYDLIHVVLLRMMPYVNKISDIPIVLDHIDSLSLNMRRRAESEKSFLKNLIFRLEEKRVKNYEKQANKIYSSAIITSQIDKDAIGDSNISVIPNGVDIDYFKPDKQAQKDIDLLFTGNMEYFPNINAVEYFFRQLYPLVRKLSPNLKVYIVGPNPPNWLKKMDDNKNVYVTGLVKDVREYYNRAKVFIASLQSGSGIQNKILEAMAMEIPVVTSQFGNNAIKAQHGEEVLVATTPEHFASAVLGLLENPHLRSTLGKQARELVRQNFSWESRIVKLEELYQSLLS